MLKDVLGAFLLLGVVLLPGNLAAQPDPLRDCRRQVSVATDAAMSDIDTRRSHDLDNGNYLLVWDARTNGRTVSGSCEADPRSGRIVRFETNSQGGGGAYRGGTMSRNDAELACQREAQRRLSVGDGRVDATLDRDDRSTYYVTWRYNSGGRTTRGSCEIDSSNGRMLRFDAGNGRDSFGSSDSSGSNYDRRSGSEDIIQARIQNGGGDGKCTFEVEVDEVAEVEIQGEQGRLITISGRPAKWRRLDCNQRLPGDPADFRFKGVDGRGSQNLIRDPGSNRGIAVIRIEDPKNGTEGYTGDITWRKGKGY